MTKVQHPRDYRDEEYCNTMARVAALTNYSLWHAPKSRCLISINHCGLSTPHDVMHIGQHTHTVKPLSSDPFAPSGTNCYGIEINKGCFVFKKINLRCNLQDTNHLHRPQWFKKSTTDTTWFWLNAATLSLWLNHFWLKSTCNKKQVLTQVCNLTCLYIFLSFHVIALTV